MVLRNHAELLIIILEGGKNSIKIFKKYSPNKQKSYLTKLVLQIVCKINFWIRDKSGKFLKKW